MTGAHKLALALSTAATLVVTAFASPARADRREVVYVDRHGNEHYRYVSDEPRTYTYRTEYYSSPRYVTYRPHFHRHRYVYYNYPDTYYSEPRTYETQT